MDRQVQESKRGKIEPQGEDIDYGPVKGRIDLRTLKPVYQFDEDRGEEPYGGDEDEEEDIDKVYSDDDPEHPFLESRRKKKI